MLGVLGEFLRARAEPIGVLLEVFAGVVPLTLNRFREPGIHADQIGEALIQARGQIGAVLAQMTGATRAVVATAAGHA